MPGLDRAPKHLNQMDAITLLTQQHRKVDALFAKFEAAKSAQQKRALFEQLADDLAVHTTLEEKLFYPAAYAGETQDILAEALEEHLSVKRIIVDLTETPSDDEAFEAKVKVMKEQVQHHVQEEEGALFPKVQKNLDASMREQLGKKMEQLYAREMKAGPSRNIAEQTDEAPDIV